MEDEMIDLYEIAESNDDWIHSIEGVEEVFDPETQKLLHSSKTVTMRGVFLSLYYDY